VGVRAKDDERGIVRKNEIVRCLKEVTEGERSREIRKNAAKWMKLTRGAAGEGGSSHTNIDEFVNLLMSNSYKSGKMIGFSNGHSFHQ